ncbi:hypothetical protein GH714_020944 [Hevea brasiliensis]|uniref:Uncharacterized protein n=1 Tax=Hevea brasiliensis TaxID=3981 RepID=A0A6A6LCS9_HEVBR|nr:hypothetical protein GH714_020944 [Hevea brasiliensis]
MDGWKKNPDTAVERFRLAGASEADISMVLKNHCSNGDAVEGDEKKDKNGNADDGRESEKSKETDKDVMARQVDFVSVPLAQVNYYL